MNEIKEDNIKNLISLWKIVGLTFNSYFSTDNSEYTYLDSSEWPNKIWFKRNDNANDFTKIKNEIIAHKNKLIFSYWHTNNYNYENSNYEIDGFVKKSTQIGMHLLINSRHKYKERLTYEDANNIYKATIWCEIFKKSFGYSISKEILLESKNDNLRFLICYHNNIPVGTVMTYVTDNIIGIHSLGILPEKRKQGFAEEIMFNVLNYAFDKRIKIATLQSSMMAKNIYLKMGFYEDFLMINYTLK